MSALTVLCEEDAAPYALIADEASDFFGLTGAAEIELVFCDEEEIRAVNASERGVDNVTDVLSFPALTLSAGQYAPFTAENFPFDINPESGAVTLGSILICTAVAARQAEEYGHGEARERGYLFLHGVLHLLGFDHIEEGDRAKMRAAEEAILARVGLRRA